MSIKKSTFVQDVFDILVKRLDLKGYSALAAYIDVPYQTLMAWKKRNSIGDYAPFMDKGISRVWLTSGQGEIFQATSPEYPLGTEKFRKYAKNVGENAVSEPDINNSQNGYPAPLRPVVESFEIATQGKSTEEINEISVTLGSNPGTPAK